jgi:peptidoglycan/LPS O-acetylase OafA/YrhL
VKTSRFVVLDGLRGIAALAVLILHIAQQRDVALFPLAGLAVDFFYMLSGFVLAFAYEDRIRTRAMSWAGFARVRVTRLYPLVLLSTLAGIALAVLAAAVKHTITYGQIAQSGILGLLLLPSYVFPQWDTAYPFNMATWSLFFEFFVNAVYAVIVARLTTRRLAGVTLLSAAVLVWVAVENGGISGGNNQANFGFGFGRVMFPFFAGVLLYRFRPAPSHAPLTALVAGLVLAVLLLQPGPWSAAMTLVYVCLLFPAIILIAAGSGVGSGLARGCELLGALSYPLYITEAPVLRIGTELLRGRELGEAAISAFGLAEAAAALLVAWLAMRFFDEPVQRWFRHVGRRRSEPVLPLVLPVARQARSGSD